jgi:hypothetical protein
MHVLVELLLTVGQLAAARKLGAAPSSITSEPTFPVIHRLPKEGDDGVDDKQAIRLVVLRNLGHHRCQQVLLVLQENTVR